MDASSHLQKVADRENSRRSGMRLGENSRRWIRSRAGEIRRGGVRGNEDVRSGGGANGTEMLDLAAEQGNRGRRKVGML